MSKNLKINYLLLLFSLSLISFLSQSQTKKWYFGNQAGLDFNTTPPTILTNNAMLANYSAASVSDASGNLLFYTNGNIVYDQTHTAMANGTGLVGFANGSGGSQTVLIVKKPGSSSIYYVVTSQWNNSLTGGLYYSEVDMSLASGNGSVTVKNATLVSTSSNTLSIGKITATKHCNGTDIWLVGRDWYYNNTVNSSTVTVNNSFRSFLITSAGINTTAVISTPSTYTYSGNWGWNYDYGCMKISPNGKKLAVALYNWNNFNSSNNDNSFELYDYDNTTGVVSNSLALLPNLTTTWNYSWGIEFSPDGTKLYGSKLNGSNTNAGVFQWDLCAGSPTAVVASVYTVCPWNVTNNNFGALQLAPDGKIYVARWGQNTLDVINNPNSLGSLCNYTIAGQSISPKLSTYSLPNFMGSHFIQGPPPTPFTSTVSNTYGCQAALFNSTYNPSITTIGCASTGYSLQAVQWNFGDPASGANNTSNLVSPIHAFTTLGTYSVNLILYYSCGGGTDTIKQVVNINQPCISVTSTSITCAHLGSATVAATGGIGPFSYTWMPSNQTNSVATGLSPGTYTLTVYDFGTNFTYTATTVFTSLIPLTGNVNNASSVTCNGASTATANVTNIAGGSGTETYAWFNTTTTYTTPTPLLGAGIWSVIVTDAMTGCQINQLFYITQPPAMNLVLSSNTSTTCAGTSATLTGLNSGGTPYATGPGYTYVWTGGPTTDTRVVSQAVAGSYVYTLTSKDSYSCPINNTIAVNFIVNPVLFVSNFSICPLQTGTLNVTGATTYTWNTATTGNTFTDNPITTTQYTVIGSALSCTSSATASIILKPVPIPLLNSNAPICNSQNLNLFGNGGTSYLWTGPLGYSSSLQYPVINLAAPNNSGVYNLTVTAANNCTASTTKTLTVNPTPTISAAGSTVCVTQVMNLYSNSFAGSSYLWAGPNSYTSALQNPFVNTPPVNASGTYTVRATSAVGCTNSATADVTITALVIPTITSTSPRCYGTTLNFTGAGGTSYLWNGPNGFNSSLQNPLIAFATVPASGIYTLQVTTGPCVINKTHTVVINPLPTFTPSGSPNVCETKSLTLTSSAVSNAITYAWQGPGFAKQGQVVGRDSCTLGADGIYTLTVIDANTCQNTATLAVPIYTNPILSTVSATVCLNQPATLKVEGAASYVWSGPNFYNSNKANAFIPSATSPYTKVYTVIGMATNNCTTVANASLSTLSLPLPALTVFPNTRVCLNNVLSMEGFGGQYYEWKGPGNFNYADKVLTFTASSMAYSGTYTLIVTDEKSCTNFTTTEITLDPLPQGGLIGTIMEACVPFKSEFTFHSAQPSPEITTDWQISNGATFTGRNFSQPFITPGDYIIKGIFTNTVSTCANTATFVVHARPIPVADFSYSPEKPVEGLDEVIFTNTSKGEEQNKWTWHFITNDGKISTQQNSSYFFKDAGVYPVAMEVKNMWGCSDTIVKAVRVETDFNIYVPNAFTPNGDNNNETFLPVCTGTKLYELIVFDRWGTKVFQTSDLKAGWDGTYNGKQCKSEVYTWRINVSSNSGEMKHFDGHITLYR